MIIMKKKLALLLVFLIMFSCNKPDLTVGKSSLQVSDIPDEQASYPDPEDTDTAKDNLDDSTIPNEQKENVSVDIDINVNANVNVNVNVNANANVNVNANDDHINNSNNNTNINDTIFDKTLIVTELKFNIDFLKFHKESKKTKDEIDQDTQFHEDDALTSTDLMTRKEKYKKEKKKKYKKYKKDDTTLSLEDKKQLKENHDKHFKKYYKDKTIVKSEPFLFTYLKDSNKNDSSSINIDLPKNNYRRVHFKIFRDLSKNKNDDDITFTNALFINMVNTKNNQNIIVETNKTINILLKSKKHYHTRHFLANGSLLVLIT